MQADTYRHKGLRRKLVDSLRKKGITDERVLAALDAVPRHFCFPMQASPNKCQPPETPKVSLTL